MRRSKRILKQIENLSDIFEFDLNNNIAKIPLHYDTPEDLLDMHLSSPKKPVVSDDTIEYLEALISYVPKEFSVDFELIIDDYLEYDPESIMRALKITIENTFYYYDETRKKDNVLAVVFLILGMMILALETVGSMDGWYGAINGVSNAIVTTILEVLVWVLAWEGAALLLMTYGNDSTYFGHALKRFHGFSLLDKEGNVKNRLNTARLYQGWIYLSGKEVLARNYILFSNAALFAILSIQTVEVFAQIETLPGIKIISFVFSFILTVGLVLSNISFYREGGPLQYCAPAFSVCCLLLTAVGIILSFVSGSMFQINRLWDGILFVVLLVNIICLRYMHRQRVETTKLGE